MSLEVTQTDTNGGNHMDTVTLCGITYWIDDNGNLNASENNQVLGEDTVADALMQAKKRLTLSGHPITFPSGRCCPVPTRGVLCDTLQNSNVA